MERQIPDSVILEVFRYLSKRELGVLAQVCRRWRRVAYDRSLWCVVNFDMNDFWPAVDEETLLMLIRTRLSSVKALNLGGCTLTAKVAKELAKRCHQLRSLVFYGAEIESETGHEGIRDFPTGLELMDLRYSWGNFKFMRRLPRHFTQMRYVGLGMDSSESLVPDVFAKMRNLRILDCTDCETLTDDALLKVSMNCPHLESICLNECKNYRGKFLHRVLSNCRSVSTLLIRFTKITDEALMAVNWEKTQVKELDLTGCYFVTTTGLSNVISRLPDIRYFKMNQCGFRHILHLRIYQESQANTCLQMFRNFGSAMELSSLCGMFGGRTATVPLPELRILEFGPLRKEALSESPLVANLIKMCPLIEAVSLINFKLIEDADNYLVQELKDKCKHIREVKLCSPRIEHVAIGNSGETITVERLLIKMESLLPSPENTLGKVINKLHV
ncbi:hypothetical protein OS493_036481 [Desmophyllum pertusum]|uniref:F-box domain-containing protein n=1 Tax=Desmophyllum pertusum TaxID=174260 RepID=A0A9X0CCP0_9CNID|nr:hypothetical protein OS493_036481 [Desmophyllum pertusum]